MKYKVMIICPSTGKAVYAGVLTDLSSWEQSDYADNQIKCPLCRQMHTWSKPDAHLVAVETTPR